MTKHPQILYDADGKSMNDSWYAYDGKIWHAFFLEREPDVPEEQRDIRHIGHAVSEDLRHWTYKGIVLSPQEGQWLDRQLATGSIAKKDGVWYMLFTAESNHPLFCSFAIATSRDLDHWELYPEPILKGKDPLPFRFNGQTFDAILLADPYVYPEAIDGWFYAYFNAQIPALPVNHRAAQAMMRSRDLLHWEPYKLACIDSADRIETAQVWKHGDRFYMYGGAVTSYLDENDQLVDDWRLCRYENFLYTADRFDGPFLRAQQLDFPGYPGNLYIAKVLTDTDGQDIMLANDIGPQGVSGPYAVTYTRRGVSLAYKP